MKEEKSDTPDLFIKVIFKGSIFNFGKNVKSFEQLEKSAILRFPELKNFSFFFGDKLISKQNFGFLIAKQFSQGQKSIKLSIKENSQQEKSEKIAQKTKKYAFNQQEFPLKTKKYSFNEDEFEDQSQKSSKDQFQVLDWTQNKPIDSSKINIKALISKESEFVQTNLSVEYFWKCILVNQSGFKIKNGIYIKDSLIDDLIEVRELQNLQKRQIIFGPYTENSVGKSAHFYQILFRNSEQTFIPIGNKFGFLCDAKKKIVTKEIENKIYQRVNKVKNFCVCEKTTEYIVKALKQFKITNDSIDKIKDQDLIELIESLSIK